MSYLIPIIIFFCCVASLYLYLRDINENKLTQGEEKTFRDIPYSALIYAGVMVVITMIISIVYFFEYEDLEIITAIKRLSLLTVLWPVGYIDFKSYRIPNSFIILGIVYRVLILPFEFIFASDTVWTYLASEGIAAVAMFLATFLCSLCIKDSIGAGDIKLFIVMGLLLGLDGLWSCVFASLIVSFIVAVYLILTKKKTRKDSIPFGPAIVIGTFLSIFLLGA